MTTTEFSDEFDVLYNSITSNNAPGLDEYEKSIFLTKAQEDLVREYFNAKVDQANGGFDGSQKRQYDFSSLLRVAKPEEMSPAETLTKASKQYFSLNGKSKRYKLPEDYFLMVNEVMETENNIIYSVMPLTYTQYQIYMSKPYPYPPKRIIWRIITNNTSYNSGGSDPAQTQAIVELIGKTVEKATYKIRYVKRPSPIILGDLSTTNLYINGENTTMTSELPVQMHREILERAVTLAKLAYQADTTQTIANNQQRRRYDNRGNE